MWSGVEWSGVEWSGVECPRDRSWAHCTLFSLYTVSLGAIVKRHGLDFHFYADDCQLYLFVQPVQALVDNAVTMIERCVNELRAWLRSHFLKCNND